MIIAWTAFIIVAVITFLLFGACAVMLYALIFEGDETCGVPLFGLALLTIVFALLTSIVAQYIWGGGL